ncbi:caspase, EACC1-associated type [Streptomyces blattellae]|uniref:caspase, EACC1-associated type n=1 Tax=Streptomyces blattellae TaxID=2569855 RepID=UPI0012B97839|nr:caspase family protein [Streptomyces blattellae]
MNTPFPDPARSRAVLIGVADYEKLPDLPAVTNNVSKLRELLMDGDLWGLPEEHCIALSGEDVASAQEVMQTLHTAAEQAKDALLVYFAGHGLSPLKFGLHLALPGGDSERLYNALDFNHIRHTLMEVCTARQRLVILDCCYGGRAFADHLGAPNEELADLAGIKGTYLLTAASATARALAPKGEEFTAFTGEIIKALDQGIPDGPDLLDTDSFFRHVRRELIAKGRPEPQQRADHFGHRIVLAHNRWDQAVSPEAAAYAQALGAAVRPALDERGGPHRDLSEALALPPAQVKRYLKGGRIAPKQVLDALADFIRSYGSPLPAEDLARLHALRRAAQRASKDTDTQLLYWREEADRLKTELDDLAQELDGSALRAERDRLLRQLGHARQYVRDTAGELADERENVRLLRREVDVLRRQVRRLLAPESTAETGESAAGDSTVSAKAPVRVADEVRAEGDGPAVALDTVPDAPPAPAAPHDATAPPPSARGAGCVLVAVLSAAVPLYLLIGVFVSLVTVDLKPSGGRQPTVAGDTYIWDVAGRVESEFAADGGAPTDRLQGSLRLEVGRECEGNPVEAEWEIAIDGHRFKNGTAKVEKPGAGTEIATDFPYGPTVHEVTLSVGSTGAAGTCDTFGLVWEGPGLSKSYDVFYAF